MQIDPDKLLQYATIFAGMAGGYFVMRAEVKILKDEAKQTKLDLKETRDLALRAHGADDTINLRITALESSVRELRDSQAKHGERVEAMLASAMKSLQETVSGFASKFATTVQDHDRRITRLDKKKLSTEKFEVVAADVRQSSPGPRPRHVPMVREDPDSE